MLSFCYIRSVFDLMTVLLYAKQTDDDDDDFATAQATP